MIEVPSGSADDLVDLLGCGPAQAEAVLTALEAKGLVARSTGNGHRFVASPPQVALGALVIERQEDLRRAQHELGALTDAYRGAAAARSVSDVVDVVLGAHAVAQRFAQMQRAARHEILLLAKAQYLVVQPEDNDDETLALSRGVAYRVALERGNLERPGFFEEVTDSLRNGVRVRVAPTIPVRLLIVDDELALVPLPAASDQTPGGGALLIHPSGLLDALRAVFALVWEGASELVLNGETLDEVGGDRLEPIDAQVLSLLLAGFTDQAIGGQLGLSLRTVQRRVRLLMDRAQVETRLQLGYQARRRGWL
jgi:hypothetical protein